MKLNKLFISLLFLGLGLGLGTLRAPQQVVTGAGSGVRVIRENSTEYHFINPILLIDNSAVTFPQYKPLHDALADEIQSEKDAGNAADVAVYFRKMNSTRWTGVNEDELFAPSSMLKLVTLLAYLKMADDNPDSLQQRVEYAPKDDPGQYYKPTHLLAAGTYTVRDLLLQMVIESDNTAMDILNSRNPDKVLDVYKELRLPDPNTPTDAFMSPEVYSRIYQTLYSSTYLTRGYSEEALELLSYTTFNKGLVQGTASTTVSHKFGEHTLLNTDGSVQYRELHDCGIVYYPDHPYFLCVMTRGQDFSKLEKVIGDISRTVYQSVKANPTL